MAFKTGGRKKGSLNKVTSEMKAAIAASGETPLEYMLRIMRDEAAECTRRDEMAKAAAARPERLGRCSLTRIVAI